MVLEFKVPASQEPLQGQPAIKVQLKALDVLAGQFVQSEVVLSVNRVKELPANREAGVPGRHRPVLFLFPPPPPSGIRHPVICCICCLAVAARDACLNRRSPRRRSRPRSSGSGPPPHSTRRR